MCWAQWKWHVVVVAVVTPELSTNMQVRHSHKLSSAYTTVTSDISSTGRQPQHAYSRSSYMLWRESHLWGRFTKNCMLTLTIQSSWWICNHSCVMSVAAAGSGTCKAKQNYALKVTNRVIEHVKHTKLSPVTMTMVIGIQIYMILSSRTRACVFALKFCQTLKFCGTLKFCNRLHWF